MKAIDWKKVASDKDLSSFYSVSVYNRFQELSPNSNIDSDNIETIYNNLIKANEEVSQSILPKKSKYHKNSIKSDEKVSLAREDISREMLTYIIPIHLRLTRSC